jgi:hypothetical protein
MLEGLKRWISGGSAATRGWDGLAPWASQHQYSFRGVREADGFVVEGRVGALPWRLEWGPSQRDYLKGNELRLRAELALQGDLQAVVMNRPLQEAMERAVFDQYVEGVQTRIDTETPPEMRWLVMFPKLAGSEMGALRERFVALASIKPWLVQWLEGPLAAALAATTLPPQTPIVLTIARGRLMLRVALADPDPPELDRWVRLFETAVREARRVAGSGFEPGAPSTQPSLWTASALPPGDGPDK